MLIFKNKNPSLKKDSLIIPLKLELKEGPGLKVLRDFFTKSCGFFILMYVSSSLILLPFKEPFQILVKKVSNFLNSSIFWFYAWVIAGKLLNE